MFFCQYRVVAFCSRVQLKQGGEKINKPCRILQTGKLICEVRYKKQAEYFEVSSKTLPITVFISQLKTIFFHIFILVVLSFVERTVEVLNRHVYRKNIHPHLCKSNSQRLLIMLRYL